MPHFRFLPLAVGKIKFYLNSFDLHCQTPAPPHYRCATHLEKDQTPVRFLNHRSLKHPESKLSLTSFPALVPAASCNSRLWSELVEPGGAQTFLLL